MTNKLPDEFIIQTDHFDIETNKNSLAHYEEKCKELNVSLDYYVFEFLV
tara:strand:- start:2751 stop:2897 length:147 start_codon:yes stop_codon:yes gene_type:complete